MIEKTVVQSKIRTAESIKGEKNIKATIVIRSMNDGPELVRRCLVAVRSQEGVDFDILHIDSGSRDGTLEVIRELGGTLYHIRPCEYIPGRVLNFAMELCSNELVVFLNADAVPVGRSWLSELIKPLLNSESVAATFSRQIAREDAQPLFVKDNERAFGDGREHSGWRHFFSMVSSAVKRSYWRTCRFSDSLRYSEDIDWTYRMRLSGAQIVYVPQSAVVHSHNYSLKQSYRRHFGEGVADAHIYRTDVFDASFVRQVLLSGLRENLRDFRIAIAEKNPAVITMSPLLRTAQRLGHYSGLKQGLKSLTEFTSIPAPDISVPTRGRFTADEEPELEARIDSDLEHIKAGILQLPHAPLALVLGGGYGRREGGVLEREGRKAPYNDYDLYAVYDSRFPYIGGGIRGALHDTAYRLGKELGIDVDIAPVSLARLRKAPRRIEWYELRRGHSVLFGPARLLDEMPEMSGSDIPYDEGERLLMNRSVGLILARRRLSALEKLSDVSAFEDVDFITRNIYKAALAAGDLVLLRHGLYHYSYRERASRMSALTGGPLELEHIKRMYASAVRFRARPFFDCGDSAALRELWLEGRAVLESAARWFVHSIRGSADWLGYGRRILDASTGSSFINRMKTARVLGFAAASDGNASTHPQMRIRASVPVLLFGPECDGSKKSAPLLDMLSKALLMPQCSSERAADIEAFLLAAETRMLDIWREVN